MFLLFFFLLSFVSFSLPLHYGKAGKNIYAR